MKNASIVVFVLLAALTPVVLAVSQDVPAGSVFKQIVLLLSLAALGLVLGEFWLSRLRPRGIVIVQPAVMLRWHKVVGYSAGGFLLVHPVLMIARRFWVLESEPVDNLLLMLRAPALLPGIVAWVLLALLVGLSLIRRHFHPKIWRVLHGQLSVVFAGLAVWHAMAVGRHANAAITVYWIVFAAGAVVALLRSYISAPSLKVPSTHQGVVHELAK